MLVDDLRWDDIGVAGHPFVETPNIDRLAREGARFLNAFAATPLCSPSRATILTGQYAHNHGIIDNTARDAASHQLPTFAIPLAASGYETAFIGKWHMGNDDTRRPGWTRWVAMKGQGEALNPKLNVDGERREVPGYVTDVLTDYAVDFVKGAADKPFMLFLAHKALHPNFVQRDDGSTETVAGQQEGFVPAERHQGRYASAPVPRRPNAGKPPVGKPALLRPIEGLPPLGAATGTPDADVRARLEMLLGVDESLGRIVRTLDELGALDDTVVIFTSDHGYFYGEHGLNEERRLAYEETARIPLIVRYPKRVRAGLMPSQMVQTIDLAPTILSLAGVTDATQRDGLSLVPLLDGKTPAWRSSLLIEYYSDTVFPRILTMGYDSVRTERYKYVRYTELPGMDELYDLETDPYEMENLIGSPEAGTSPAGTESGARSPEGQQVNSRMRIRSLVFAMIFGFAFTGYLQRQGVGIVAERIMPELGLTQVQVGWLITAFLFTYAIFQVPGALIGQRFGARWTITAFGLLTVIASVLTAAAPFIAAAGLMFTSLVLARSLLGVAQGGLFPVASGTIRYWYPVTAWSSMVGLMVTGLWSGAATASPLVAWLMQAYGWQAALLITSVPSLLLVALWFVFVRDRPELHPAVTPAELAELNANPPLRRRGAADGKAHFPRARGSADPAHHALVSRHELCLLPRDVLELPVPRAGAEALRPRERLARRPALRRRRHRLGNRRPHRGSDSAAASAIARAAHPAARDAAARGSLPLPDGLARESVLRDRGALPRLRLCRAQRGQLLGRGHAARAERLDGGDRGPEHRRQPRRSHRNADHRGALRVAGRLGRRVR